MLPIGTRTTNSFGECMPVCPHNFQKQSDIFVAVPCSKLTRRARARIQVRTYEPNTRRIMPVFLVARLPPGARVEVGLFPGCPRGQGMRRSVVGIGEAARPIHERLDAVVGMWSSMLPDGVARIVGKPAHQTERDPRFPRCRNGARLIRGGIPLVTAPDVVVAVGPMTTQLVRAPWMPSRRGGRCGWRRSWSCCFPLRAPRCAAHE